MPTVHVRYILDHEGHVLKESILKALGPALATAVANHLTCDKAVTTANEVIVFFRECLPLDILPTQVMIEVEHSYCPSCDANLQDRTDGLGADIRHLLPMHFGFEVRILLYRSKRFTAEPSNVSFGHLLKGADPGDNDGGYDSIARP